MSPELIELLSQTPPQVWVSLATIPVQIICLGVQIWAWIVIRRCR